MAREDLKRYAMTKCISAQAFDLATDKLLAETKHTKTFNVTDTTPMEFLVGGEEMANLLGISGKQEASFTFTTATDSLDWKALQLNTKVEKGIKEVPTDAYFTVESEKVTLGVVKRISAIKATEDDADGRDGEEIEVVTLKPQHYEIGTALTVVADGAMTDPLIEVELSTVQVDIPTIQIGDTVDLIPAEVLATGQCTVDLTTGEITFYSDMEDKEVHIYYTKEMESVGYKSNGGQAPAIKFVATGIFVDVDTKIPFLAKYIAYNAQLEQNDATQANNEGVPADIEYKINCLKSRKYGCTYEVVAIQRDELAE